MYCIHCGEQIGASPNFCGACGTKVIRQDEGDQRSESTVPLSSTSETSPTTPSTLGLGETSASSATGAVESFDIQAGALAWFFRYCAVVAASAFVIPMPWIACWFSRWAVSQVRLGDRRTLEFEGTPGSVAILAILYWLVVWGWVPVVGAFMYEADPDFIANVIVPFSWVLQLVPVLLGWAWIRWNINHIQLEGRSWRFDGSFWGYLGWMLFELVAVFSIIGWAWVMAAYWRWIAGHIQDAGGQIRFIGKGHQVLWRTMVAFLGCIFIVPVPWLMRWYIQWVTQQFELHRQAESSPAW